MSKRQNMPRNADRHFFRNNADKTKTINVKMPMFRGGIRL